METPVRQPTGCITFRCLARSGIGSSSPNIHDTAHGTVRWVRSRLSRDAQATIRLATEQYGKPVYLLGESIGCGVVAAAVRDKTAGIAGIVLITPWDTLRAAAKTHFPWLPVGLFLKDRYDNIENLKSFGGRIAVVGAERDEIVPFRHADALYRSLSGVKRMWTIKGAGHNNWPAFVDTPRWREFMDFVGGAHPG